MEGAWEPAGKRTGGGMVEGEGGERMNEGGAVGGVKNLQGGPHELVDGMKERFKGRWVQKNKIWRREYG
jgi:hypothetical protein